MRRPVTWQARNGQATLGNPLVETMRWCGPDDDLGRYVASQCDNTLRSYREQPLSVVEHANLERDTAHGGYQHRQMYELVQNAADALWSGPGSARRDGINAAEHSDRGRIEVRLSKRCLYCADDGDPIDESGMTALMFSHMSPKRATGQIGTFGLGFKAVLGVSDDPEFYSRSGSFRFQRSRSAQQIRAVVPREAAVRNFPVLRLPEPIEPLDAREDDPVLSEMMSWATNVVRLPLKRAAFDDLKRQMADFPAEFILFVPHVASLTLIVGDGSLQRHVQLTREGDDFVLDDGTDSARWRVFQRSYRLSAAARADRRPGDDADEVQIWWAAPVDHAQRHDRFWAHFPTETACLVSGILNAPWKTNEDRQNLLTGEYNDELVRAAAVLVAGELPSLSHADDPARHLDLLPRRHEPGDNRHADLLRDVVNELLSARQVVPDQTGELRQITSVCYLPRELERSSSQSVDALRRWETSPSRPIDWLHHSAYRRARFSAIGRLFEQTDEFLLQQPVIAWLEALVRNADAANAVPASAAAIQAAALLPVDVRNGIDRSQIVYSMAGGWLPLDPERVFLSDPAPAVGAKLDPRTSVHAGLLTDDATLTALKAMGFAQPSAESEFNLVAGSVLDSMIVPEDAASVYERLWVRFWTLSRLVSETAARDVISSYGDFRRDVRVRTLAGAWSPVYEVLIPGAIVPIDGSRDGEVGVDLGFHGADLRLLEWLGVGETAQHLEQLTVDPAFWRYARDCEDKYRQQRLQRNPQSGMLGFFRSDGVGPLSVIRRLSDEGRMLYTSSLMDVDSIYESYDYGHRGTSGAQYPINGFESPALNEIRRWGRVATTAGFAHVGSALGANPDDPEALEALYRHSNAAKIKEALDLADPAPTTFGEQAPIPLTDMWPTVATHLTADDADAQLVRCDQIFVAGKQRDCVYSAPSIFLASGEDDDEYSELHLVSRAMDLSLTGRQVMDIVDGTTAAEVEQRRQAIRNCSSDAERVLAAVGERALRDRLPRSLVRIVEKECADAGSLPVAIAESALATYHTGTLREFRAALKRLDPPKQWAGSRRAVSFVRSLGFSEEWAGEPGRADDPFEQVEGPLKLGGLHDYQRAIADRLKDLLSSPDRGEQDRRGLISLPTGAGKTRVAVQAVVEARRDQSFRGDVLWVADRRELCEQAVQAWKQVWRSEGIEDARLRVSRLWGGNASPTATDDWHVIVASIQTLHARLSHQRLQQELLEGVGLVVFDEAHRSIAPTYTTAMAEIGLTYRQSADEPALLGLTATPYRGHNEAETRWLANRYGQNRLDAGAFSSDDPHSVISHLQDTAVLARADHALIDGGTYELTRDEQAEIAKFGGSDATTPRRGFLPTSVEERIAEDAERTDRILEAYERHVSEDWPTLIFATSVDHSKTLAALLTLRGITARAVSGETDTASRRRVVDGFRAGEINVLVNYGVFREGFDAPKTRAIIVARPVYSPNLYFQMVGRGLRGPLNGGDERCLILNVQDNIENYGEELAFADVDWLWSR